MTNKPTLLVMAGGTGGHIFPALAVAQLLQQQGWNIAWLGTADRMEAKLVPQYGIPLHTIQISGLRGKGIKALLKAPFAILRAVSQAKKIIQTVKPNAVLGMGGYVSGPGGIAAKLCGVPIVLHEQNAVAGLTNAWLAKVAQKVLQAFPTAFDKNKAPVVGNPVRADFFTQPTPKQRFKQRRSYVGDKLCVLVAGGSQGAKILNEVVPAWFAQAKPNVIIRHQAGANNAEKVQALYDSASAGEAVSVTEFIDDMANAYAWADVVICRSGALTVCELAAVGSAAIFVPFPHKDEQQRLNGEYLANAGAAEIINQRDFNAEKLAQIFAKYSDVDFLHMGEKAQQLASPNSAEIVAQAVIDMAKIQAKDKQ